MSQASEHHVSHKKEYFAVFVILAVLTLIELFIPGLENVSKFVKGTALTGLAIAKAFVVAWFYMHLKEETRWLKFVAAIPISAGIYAVVVILESMFR